MNRNKKIAFFGGLIIIALFVAAVSAGVNLERRANAAEVSGTVSGGVGGSTSGGTVGGSVGGSTSGGTVGGSVGGSSISGTVGGGSSGGSGGGGSSSSSGSSGGSGGGGSPGSVLGATTGPGADGQVLGAQLVPSLPTTGMSPFLFIPWLLGMLALIIWLSSYVASLDKVEKSRDF